MRAHRTERTCACSALHSDLLVGLDRAKMMGGPAQLSLIVVSTSSGRLGKQKYQALKQTSDFVQMIKTCENSTDAGEPDEDIRLDLFYDVLEAHALPIVLLCGKVGEVVE